MDLKRAQLLSDPAAEEEAEDDELELSLELSLARRSSKVLHVSDSGMESGKASVDLCSGDPGLAGSEALSAAAPLLNLKLNVPSSGGEPHPLDSQQWRMLHALRRKRKEQQQSKVTASQRGNGLVVPPVPSFSVDELTVLEAQEAQFQCRSSDREARERDSFWAERRSSGRKIPDNVFIPSSNSSQNSMPNGNGNTPAVLPMVPVRCEQVQYVPIVNGSGSPYMMPCWAPVVSRPGNSASRLETNVFHPVPYRGFNLFPVPSASTNSTGVDTKPTRSGSPGSSSSSMSDDEYRGSLQVGSSNDCPGRNPSHSSAGKPELQTSQFSCSIPYNQMGAGKRVSNSVQASLGSNDKQVSITTQASMVSNSPSLLPGKIERAASVNKPVSMAAEEPQDETSLPRMPRVSTTGDGPNGKTITGFLYRYDKSEVSIVCVCHGSSFSPAEFVRHAGGTNVANPLRRIVVVPS